MSSKFLMTQREIAEASGYSQQFISKIINGDSRPHPDTAEELEKATGICREAWLWPEERHWNPYIPFADARSCLHCSLRISRVQKWKEVALSLIEKNPSRKGLQELLEGIVQFNNYDTEFLHMCYGRIDENGIEKLAWVGYDATPEVITEEYAMARFPWAWQLLKSGQDIYLPYVHEQLPVEAPVDLAWVKKKGHKSVYVIQADGFFFQMSAFLESDHIILDPKQFEGIKEIIRSLKPFIEHLL